MKALLYLMLMTLIILSGCGTDDKNSDCGCGSNTVFTIQDTDNQIGFLYKNTVNNNINNIPKYTYGVWFSEDNCVNCVHTFFVCNDSFLKEFGEIPSYPGTMVTFSGRAKRLCENPIGPGDYTYNFIELTKMTKQ